MRVVIAFWVNTKFVVDNYGVLGRSIEIIKIQSSVAPLKKIAVSDFFSTCAWCFLTENVVRKAKKVFGVCGLTE